MFRYFLTIITLGFLSIFPRITYSQTPAMFASNALISYITKHPEIKPEILIQAIEQRKEKVSHPDKKLLINETIVLLRKHYSIQSLFFEGQETYDELVHYAVAPGKLISDSGHASARLENIRKLWQQLIPKARSGSIVGVHTYSDSSSKDVASVHPSLQENGKRELLLNMHALYPNGLFQEGQAIYTIIHEISHIITLDANQFQEIGDMCSTYQIEEGCLTENSYLYQFILTYRESLLTHGSADSIQKDPTAFLNNYAATDPVEDIAESFTIAVLTDGNPEGVSPKAQEKVLWTDKQPLLLQVRKQMSSVYQSLQNQ